MIPDQLTQTVAGMQQRLIALEEHVDTLEERVEALEAKEAPATGGAEPIAD
jgi:phage shock protein A